VHKLGVLEQKRSYVAHRLKSTLAPALTLGTQRREACKENAILKLKTDI
jgi:hypothetical protein